MRRLCDVLQAHTAPIRCITFTHNDKWLLSTDDSGLVRLWTPRLELAQVRDWHRCTADLISVVHVRRAVTAHVEQKLLMSSAARQHADMGHYSMHACAACIE